MPDYDHEVAPPPGVPPKRRVLDFVTSSLWATAGVSFFAAGIFYLLEYYLDTHLKESFWAHIAQHISIAFLVACISIVGIESFAKSRNKREVEEIRRLYDDYIQRVSKDVFNAVLGRNVHDSLLKEIQEIMAISFLRTDCHYTFRFLEPYPDMNPEYYVLRRDLAFEVTNISDRAADFHIVSSYNIDEDLQKSGWGDRPLHRSLRIKEDDDDNPSRLYRDIPYEEFTSKRGRFVMDYRLRLNPAARFKVVVHSEEPKRIEANRSTFYQGTPVDGINVAIENFYSKEIGEITVNFYHPAGQELIEEDTPNHYIFRRTFLPGQSFDVVWRQVTHDQSGTGSEET